MRDRERGASAVEFAIVLTVLVMLLFGTIQFGMAFHRAQGLEAAAREGARLASIGATAGEIVERTRRAQSLFRPEDVDVQISPAAGGTQPPCAIAGIGGFVEVTAVVPPSPSYAIAIPLWGQREIEYTATGTFRCERARR